MPRMSGLDAIKNLRKVHDQKLPIIALTAHLIDSEKEAIIAAGANDILIKPLIFDNLSAKLTLWMGGTKRDGKTSSGGMGQESNGSALGRAETAGRLGRPNQCVSSQVTAEASKRPKNIAGSRRETFSNNRMKTMVIIAMANGKKLI